MCGTCDVSTVADRDGIQDRGAGCHMTGSSASKVMAHRACIIGCLVKGGLIVM